MKLDTWSCFGFASGRQICSPLSLTICSPSESCTSSRKSSMRERSDSSKKNMDVSGAMPTLSRFTRGNNVSFTSITVSVPGTIENR